MEKFTDINNRSRGLVNNMHEFNYHILGCGAIGSSAATQLARMGAFNFCLYDNDKVDIQNIGVSQYTIYDIDHAKVDMLKSKILDINDLAEVVCEDRMFENYMYLNSNDIIVLGFDSMKSRIEAVRALSKWGRNVKPYALIDGRMGAEHYQQYVMLRPNLKEYEKHWYSDEEGSEEPCNAKATSYCSNMAGSFIANAVRKVVMKQPYEEFVSFFFPTMTIEKNTCVFPK